MPDHNGILYGWGSLSFQNNFKNLWRTGLFFFFFGYEITNFWGLSNGLVPDWTFHGVQIQDHKNLGNLQEFELEDIVLQTIS